MEATRAMLHDQDLPMHLWVKVSRIVVYVQNRTPHRVLENKTPEEFFFSKKLEVSHLRIFKKRTKLDPSGKKGIFVGYSKSSKAYRIYLLAYKNIDISRDVTFNEDIAYNKSRKRLAEEPEEAEAPRIHDTTMNK